MYYRIVRDYLDGPKAETVRRVGAEPDGEEIRFRILIDGQPRYAGEADRQGLEGVKDFCRNTALPVAWFIQIRDKEGEWSDL
jgi:hypothetical protein